MISEESAKSYCKDDISLTENYDKAIADTTQVWHCHHRRETVLSRKDLIEIGEYYNRPAVELIFLTKSDHNSIHKKNNKNCLGKHHSEDTRKKIREAKNGKHHSAETRLKISESHKGENHPLFGKHHSDETRQKMSEAHKGRNHSDETRQKMSEAHKGKHWYNNGVKSIRAKECPKGFVKGRISL